MSVRRTIATLLAATAAFAGVAASAGSASAVEVNSVTDGGFEATYVLPDESPESDSWSDEDNEFGYVVCTTLTTWCPRDVHVGPHSGNGWLWFGESASGTHSASVRQTVVVPEGATELTYWYRNGQVDAPFNAILKVSLDGELVNFHQEATAPGTDYHQYVVDISDFADNGPHVLSFDYDGGSPSTSGLQVNDMEIDDVAIH